MSIRRLARRIGVGACVLVIATDLASSWYAATWSGRFIIWGGVDAGTLCIAGSSYPMYICSIDPHRFYRFAPWPTLDADQSGWVAKIPLWMLPFALILPAAYAFARDRLIPNSCLHCSYPLTGLAPNSPCPECGKPPCT